MTILQHYIFDKIPKVITMYFEALLTGTPQVEFTREMLNEKGLILIEFYAKWSGASHIMNPVFKEIREKFENEIKSFRLDFDKYKEIAVEFGLHNAPAYIIFHNGRVVDMYQGIVNKKTILNKIKILIRNN